MLRQVNKSIFCHQRRLGKQALTFALQQGISEIILTALAATQLAEVAAEELLADEALDKAHADLKHTKKKRQKAQKQVQQQLQQQQPIDALDTHLEQAAAAEQQVQHGAQHMQAAQLQAAQSLRTAESAAVAQHAKQKQNGHLNLLQGVTKQLSSQLLIQPSDQAGPSAHQTTIPTELKMPSNSVAAQTSALFLCPLTKVTLPLDL